MYFLPLRYLSFSFLHLGTLNLALSSFYSHLFHLGHQYLSIIWPVRTSKSFTLFVTINPSHIYSLIIQFCYLHAFYVSTREATRLIASV